MSKKLYVGNLSYETTADELEALFAKAGVVNDVALIEDRMTGRSRGFAFVEMADDAEAASAIERFNGTEFGGRNLNVSEARPRAERDQRGGGDRGGRGRGGWGGRDSRRNSW